MTCLQAPTGSSLSCLSFNLSFFTQLIEPRSLAPSIGTKFVLLTTPSHPFPEPLLKKVYETYADYLKDPFYTVEMPIRSETFDVKMASVIRVGV